MHSVVSVFNPTCKILPTSPWGFMYIKVTIVCKRRKWRRYHISRMFGLLFPIYQRTRRNSGGESNKSLGLCAYCRGLCRSPYFWSTRLVLTRDIIRNCFQCYVPFILSSSIFVLLHFEWFWGKRESVTNTNRRRMRNDQHQISRRNWLENRSFEIN